MKLAPMSSLCRFVFPVVVLLLLAPAHAFAAVPAPEIDPSAAASGLVLLTGTIMLVRARRRR